jgi:hypothetical protein
MENPLIANGDDILRIGGGVRRAGLSRKMEVSRYKKNISKGPCLLKPMQLNNISLACRRWGFPVSDFSS